MAWITGAKKEKREPKTDNRTLYKIGDIVKILLHDEWNKGQVGSIALITETSNDSYAVKTLTGENNIGAWWKSEDFNLIELNYVDRVSNEQH